jgi:hypothetical protein
MVLSLHLMRGILYLDQVLLEYGLEYFETISPFHSELQAIHLPVEALKDKGNPEATVPLIHQLTYTGGYIHKE